MSQEPYRLWTVQETAEYLHCSVRHVHNLTRFGLPAIHIGRSLRFKPEHVREYLELNTQRTAHSERMRRRQIAKLKLGKEDIENEYGA